MVEREEVEGQVPHPTVPPALMVRLQVITVVEAVPGAVEAQVLRANPTTLLVREAVAVEERMVAMALF